ncbi:peptidoglycan recognition protein family protein [Maribacter stanieri]|uniref:peptidoglycan recognition protein family protein n=1 Tax=Maribacter stanieri TaxID=440514 RepID=UPI0024948771|nr:peptidoglycan recognition family protein [Maribacter stanieri]|tara:strand:- start:183 stop:842 length:660 start_codon:yes stop_codon:yes gene_type:complete
MKHSAVYFIFGLLIVSCTSTKSIVDHPITFNEERKILTLEYLQNRYGLEQESPKIDPKMIVLHWTVIPTFQKSFEAFDPVTLPNWRPDIKNVSGLNVSSQFMVDRDGTIYQLLPETTMARHVIGLNHCAIGVENIGGTEELPLTKAQLKSNIWLVKYLKDKYDIDYLIGHYEYTLFENHPLWLEKDEGYRTVKTDPGPDFMNNVRKAVKNLNFKELPKN